MREVATQFAIRLWLVLIIHSEKAHSRSTRMIESKIVEALLGVSCISESVGDLSQL